MESGFFKNGVLERKNKAFNTIFNCKICTQQVKTYTDKMNVYTQAIVEKFYFEIYADALFIRNL